MEDYYTVQTPDHHNILFQELHTLQKQGVLCDVVLAAEDGEVMAHKVVLMAASRYFREKLSQTVSSTVSKIYLKGISVVELANLVKYIYTGKLLVAKETMDVTLEVSEILQLNGVLRGYKEISAYEEMKNVAGDMDMHVSSAPISGQDVHMSSTAGTSPYAAQGTGNQNIVPVVESAAVSSDIQAQQQDIQVTEYREDGSSVTYTIEQGEAADTVANPNSANEYSFEFNPYEEQYMDVSVGTSTQQTMPPVPPLQKLGQSVSEEQRAVDEQAQHQDLLSVAIEKLTGDSTRLESQHKQSEAELAVEAIVSQEVVCNDAALASPTQYSVGGNLDGKFVNGKIDTKIVTLDAGIVNNEMGGKTAVYTVALDPSSVKRPLKMPRPLKKKTEKEKEAQKLAEMYRQKKKEMKKQSDILLSALQKPYERSNVPMSEKTSPLKQSETPEPIIKNPDIVRTTRSSSQQMFSKKSPAESSKPSKMLSTPKVSLKEKALSPQVSKTVTNPAIRAALESTNTLLGTPDKLSSKTETNLFASMNKETSKTTVNKEEPKTEIVYDTSEDFSQVVNFDSDEDDHTKKDPALSNSTVESKTETDDFKGLPNDQKQAHKTKDNFCDTEGTNTQNKKGDIDKNEIQGKCTDVHPVSSKLGDESGNDKNLTVMESALLKPQNSKQTGQLLETKTSPTKCPDKSSSPLKKGCAKDRETFGKTKENDSLPQCPTEKSSVPSPASGVSVLSKQHSETKHVKLPTNQNIIRAEISASISDKHGNSVSPKIATRSRREVQKDLNANNNISDKSLGSGQFNAKSGVGKLKVDLKNAASVVSIGSKEEKGRSPAQLSSSPKSETGKHVVVGESVGITVDESSGNKSKLEQNGKKINSDVTNVAATAQIVRKALFSKKADSKLVQNKRKQLVEKSEDAASSPNKQNERVRNVPDKKDTSTIIEVVPQVIVTGKDDESVATVKDEQLSTSADNDQSATSQLDSSAQDTMRSSATKRKGKVPRRLPSTEPYRFCSNGNSIPMVRTRRNSRNDANNTNGSVTKYPQVPAMPNIVKIDNERIQKTKLQTDERVHEAETSKVQKSQSDFHEDNIKKSVHQDVFITETGRKIIVAKHMLPKVRLKKFTKHDIISFAKNMDGSTSIDEEEEETDTEFDLPMEESFIENKETGEDVEEEETDTEFEVGETGGDTNLPKESRNVTNANESEVSVANAEKTARGEKRKAEEPDTQNNGQTDRKKSKISSFVCGCCNKTFRQLKTLSKHMKTCRKKRDSPLDMEMECSTAEEDEAEPVAPKDGKRKKNNQKEPSCDITPVKEEPDMKYICPEENCMFMSEKIGSITKHLVMFHHIQGSSMLKNIAVHQVPAKDSAKADNKPDGTSGNSLRCSCCENKFETLNALQLHIWKKVRNKSGCDLCGSTFMTAVACVNHRIQEHGLVIPSSIRHFECSLCDFIGFSYKDIDTHYLEHEEGKIICGKCDKVFSTPSQLTEHLATHEKGKPYQCDDCDFVTDTKVGLNTHCSHEHKKTNILVKCRFCPYKTVFYGNLRKHTLRTHNIIIVTKQNQGTYLNHPPGTMLTLDGKVFDPDTATLPKKTTKRDPFTNTGRSGRRTGKTPLTRLPPEQFKAELLKRHNEYCKMPDKPKRFMSKSLAIATAHPSFPQASPSVRGSKANKLYNSERHVTRVEEISNYVTGVHGNSPVKGNVPQVGEEIEVGAGGSCNSVVSISQQNSNNSHMVVIDGCGRRQVVNSTDFYQSVANRSIEVITTLLEAGQQIEKEVEVHNT